MVLTGCSTSTHNELCGNSVIDGVLESSLSVKIAYNLVCIRLCAFYKSILDIVCRHHKDIMVVRVEGSRNLLSREDLQRVSRVCCLLYVGRFILFLTGISTYFHRRGECCIYGFPKYTHSVCWWRLAIFAGGLSSACKFQSNPRKLTRGKLLMKHTYTILLT